MSTYITKVTVLCISIINIIKEYFFCISIIKESVAHFYYLKDTVLRVKGEYDLGSS